MKMNKSEKDFRSASKSIHSQSSSEGSWVEQLRNEPHPSDLKPRLLGLRYSHRSSVEGEDGDDNPMQGSCAEVLEEDEPETQKPQRNKLFRHVKFMADKGEFSGSRSRIIESRPAKRSPERSRSVSSLRLPQVLEEKKEYEELHRKELSKLRNVADKDEFNRCRSGETLEVKPVVYEAQLPSLTLNSYGSRSYSSSLPYEIVETEAEQFCFLKPTSSDLSCIEANLSRIKVDEIDDKKRTPEIEDDDIAYITEDHAEEELYVDTYPLHKSLCKLKSELEQFSNRFNEDTLDTASSDEGSEGAHSKPTKQASSDPVRLEIVPE